VVVVETQTVTCEINLELNISSCSVGNVVYVIVC